MKAAEHYSRAQALAEASMDRGETPESLATLALVHALLVNAPESVTDPEGTAARTREAHDQVGTPERPVWRHVLTPDAARPHSPVPQALEGVAGYVCRHCSSAVYPELTL